VDCGIRGDPRAIYGVVVADSDVPPGDGERQLSGDASVTGRKSPIFFHPTPPSIGEDVYSYQSSVEMTRYSPSMMGEGCELCIFKREGCGFSVPTKLKSKEHGKEVSFVPPYHAFLLS
jgi:hypothetical protein